MSNDILCALVIGHSKSSPGAINHRTGITEFSFNERLSMRIAEAVNDVNVVRVYRDRYKDLPAKINALNPDFIISLHANAYNRCISGTEVLYYHRSIQSKALARVLLTHLISRLYIPNRGLKATNSEGRGGYLLRYTNTPCVISEPFFIDHDNDLNHVRDNMDQLVQAYADSIEQYARVLGR